MPRSITFSFRSLFTPTARSPPAPPPLPASLHGYGPRICASVRIFSPRIAAITSIENFRRDTRRAKQRKSSPTRSGVKFGQLFKHVSLTILAAGTYLLRPKIAGNSSSVERTRLRGFRVRQTAHENDRWITPMKQSRFNSLDISRLIIYSQFTYIFP